MLGSRVYLQLPVVFFIPPLAVKTPLYCRRRLLSAEGDSLLSEARGQRIGISSCRTCYVESFHLSTASSIVLAESAMMRLFTSVLLVQYMGLQTPGMEIHSFF